MIVWMITEFKITDHSNELLDRASAIGRLAPCVPVIIHMTVIKKKAFK